MSDSSDDVGETLDLMSKGALEAVVYSLRNSMADGAFVCDCCTKLLQLVSTAPADKLNSLELVPTLIVALKRYCTRTEVQVSAVPLLSVLASKSPGLKSSIVTENAIPILLNNMRAFLQEPAALTTLCECLFELAEDDSVVQQQIVSNGGIAHLLEGMKVHFSNPLVVVPICGIIMNVSEVPPGIAELRRLEALEVLQYCMKQQLTDVVLQYRFLKTVVNITNACNTGTALDTDLLDVVFNIFRFQSEKQVHYTSMIALYNIMEHSDKFKHGFLQQNGVKLLCQAMGSSFSVDANLHIIGGKLLKLFCDMRPQDEVHDALIKWGVAKALMAALHAHCHNAEVIEAILPPILSLAGNNSTRSSLIGAGVVPTIVRLLQVHTSVVVIVEEVIDVLLLILESHDCIQSCINSHVISYTTSIMQNHPKNTAVLCRVFKLYSTLCSQSTKCVDTIASKDKLTSMTNLMKTNLHDMDDDTLAEFLLFLTIISVIPSYQIELRSLQVLTLCLFILNAKLDQIEDVRTHLVLERGIHTIGNVLSHPAHPVTTGEASTLIPAALSITRGCANPSLHSIVFWFFSVLCRAKAGRDELQKSGIVEMMLNALRQHYSYGSVVRHVMDVAEQLTQYAEFSAALHAQGFIPQLLASMLHCKGKAEVQIPALTVVANLAESFWEALIKESAVSHVVQTLKSLKHDAAVSLAGLKALQALAVAQYNHKLNETALVVDPSGAVLTAEQAELRVAQGDTKSSFTVESERVGRHTVVFGGIWQNMLTGKALSTTTDKSSVICEAVTAVINGNLNDPSPIKESLLVLHGLLCDKVAVFPDNTLSDLISVIITTLIMFPELEHACCTVLAHILQSHCTKETCQLLVKFELLQTIEARLDKLALDNTMSGPSYTTTKTIGLHLLLCGLFVETSRENVNTMLTTTKLSDRILSIGNSITKEIEYAKRKLNTSTTLDEEKLTDKDGGLFLATSTRALYCGITFLIGQILQHRTDLYPTFLPLLLETLIPLAVHYLKEENNMSELHPDEQTTNSISSTGSMKCFIRLLGSCLGKLLSEGKQVQDILSAVPKDDVITIMKSALDTTTEHMHTMLEPAICALSLPQKRKVGMALNTCGAHMESDVISKVDSLTSFVLMEAPPDQDDDDDDDESSPGMDNNVSIVARRKSVTDLLGHRASLGGGGVAQFPDITAAPQLSGANTDNQPKKLPSVGASNSNGTPDSSRTVPTTTTTITTNSTPTGNITESNTMDVNNNVNTNIDQVRTSLPALNTKSNPPTTTTSAKSPSSTTVAPQVDSATKAKRKKSDTSLEGLQSIKSQEVILSPTSGQSEGRDDRRERVRRVNSLGTRSWKQQDTGTTAVSSSSHVSPASSSRKRSNPGLGDSVTSNSTIQQLSNSQVAPQSLGNALQVVQTHMASELSAIEQKYLTLRTEMQQLSKSATTEKDLAHYLQIENQKMISMLKHWESKYHITKFKAQSMENTIMEVEERRNALVSKYEAIEGREQMIRGREMQVSGNERVQDAREKDILRKEEENKVKTNGLKGREETIKEMERLAQKNKTEVEQKIRAADQTLQERVNAIQQREQILEERIAEVKLKESASGNKEVRLTDKERELLQKQTDLDKRQLHREKEVDAREKRMDGRELRMEEREVRLEERESQWMLRERQRELELADREQQLRNRELDVTLKEKEVSDRERQLQFDMSEVRNRESNISKREQELRLKRADFEARRAKTTERLTKWESALKARDKGLAKKRKTVEVQEKEVKQREEDVKKWERQLFDEEEAHHMADMSGKQTASGAVVGLLSMTNTQSQNRVVESPGIPDVASRLLTSLDRLKKAGGNVGNVGGSGKSRQNIREQLREKIQQRKKQREIEELKAMRELEVLVSRRAKAFHVALGKLCLFGTNMAEVSKSESLFTPAELQEMFRAVRREKDLEEFGKVLQFLKCSPISLQWVDMQQHIRDIEKWWKEWILTYDAFSVKTLKERKGYLNCCLTILGSKKACTPVISGQYSSSSSDEEEGEISAIPLHVPPNPNMKELMEKRGKDWDRPLISLTLNDGDSDSVSTTMEQSGIVKRLMGDLASPTSVSLSDDMIGFRGLRKSTSRANSVL